MSSGRGIDTDVFILVAGSGLWEACGSNNLIAYTLLRFGQACLDAGAKGFPSVRVEFIATYNRFSDLPNLAGKDALLKFGKACFDKGSKGVCDERSHSR